MLGDELSMMSLGLSAHASVGNGKPSGFGFVSKQNVSSVVELEPSPNSLGQTPHMFRWLLVKPMSQGTFCLLVSSPCGQVVSELSLESRENVVERQCVGTQMHPS